MSKERQKKRKKAAAQAGVLHPTRGWQKTQRRVDHSKEESAWVALKRHLVEPFQALHQDDDPEQPAPFVLDCLFELGYRWSSDQVASFVAVPLVKLLAQCTLELPEFGHDAILAAVDELVATQLAIVADDTVRLIVEPDVLDRINKGERLLD
jgi:hypothetical protein